MFKSYSLDELTTVYKKGGSINDFIIMHLSTIWVSITIAQVEEGEETI